VIGWEVIYQQKVVAGIWLSYLQETGDDILPFLSDLVCSTLHKPQEVLSRFPDRGVSIDSASGQGIHENRVFYAAVDISLGAFPVVLALIVCIDESKRDPRTLVESGDDAGNLSFVDAILESRERDIRRVQNEEIQIPRASKRPSVCSTTTVLNGMGTSSPGIKWQVKLQGKGGKADRRHMNSKKCLEGKVAVYEVPEVTSLSL